MEPSVDCFSIMTSLIEAQVQVLIVIWATAKYGWELVNFMLHKAECKPLLFTQNSIKYKKGQHSSVNQFNLFYNNNNIPRSVYLLLRASRLIYRGLAARGGFRRGCGGCAVSTL